MRIVVCDDNLEFGNELKKYIHDSVVASSIYDDSFVLEYIPQSKKLISYLSEHDVDILFLDILMPELDGFAVAQYINDNNLSTVIIFVSSFENNVFYSLRYKPFRFIRKEKYKEEVDEALKSAYIELKAKNRYIMIAKHSEVIPIRISRIIYAEKEKRSNYMSIYTVDGVYRYRGTLLDFESEVVGSHFVKASQNAYMNMEQIINIKDGCIYLKGGYEYYIAKKYQNEVIQEFFRFMREDKNGTVN
ncbi:MAG: response regulator transcription factor [Ruminococcaceae bacterium]|nr:response regulator transcription factor [Oscillospiraceae bacterium]